MVKGKIMGTIVTFEQDPLRLRMRKKPKAVAEGGVILPFAAEYKTKDTDIHLMSAKEDKSCPLDAQRPA